MGYNMTTSDPFYIFLNISCNQVIHYLWILYAQIMNNLLTTNINITEIYIIRVMWIIVFQYNKPTAKNINVYRNV